MWRFSFYDKVILGFVAIVVCAFVGVGIGISRMNDMNSRLNIVVGDIFRQTLHAEEMNSGLESIRREEKNMILALDDKDNTWYIARAEEINAKLKK